TSALKSVISIKFPIFVYLLAVLFSLAFLNALKNEQNGCLGRQKYRNHSEQELPCLVMKQIHACQRTSRAADKSQSQQSRFRNPVFVPDSSPFIHSKCYKCNKIDQDEITDGPVKILHSFFPFCISERPGNARTF